jgi:hypothetical protein
MANQNQYGSFIPTTYVWDVGTFYQADVNSMEFKELLVRLHEFVNLIAINTNFKDTGYYALDEFVNSQLYFPNPAAPTNMSQIYRQVYRKTFNVGPLPNAGTKTIPHGIVCNVGTTFTRIYGAASDTTSERYIPLPFAAPVALDSIQVDVDSTNIHITTGVDYTAFNVVYIVLEYLKQ